MRDPTDCRIEVIHDLCESYECCCDASRNCIVMLPPSNLVGIRSCREVVEGKEPQVAQAANRALTEASHNVPHLFVRGSPDHAVKRKVACVSACQRKTTREEQERKIRLTGQKESGKCSGRHAAGKLCLPDRLNTLGKALLSCRPEGASERGELVLRKPQLALVPAELPAWLAVCVDASPSAATVFVARSIEWLDCRELEPAREAVCTDPEWRKSAINLLVGADQSKPDLNRVLNLLRK